MLGAVVLWSCTTTTSKPANYAPVPGGGAGADSGAVSTSDSGGPATDSGGPIDTGPRPCFADPPAVTIGTGEASFLSLSDGDPVTMVHGPQGGWHIAGSVRIDNMDDVVDIRFTITEPSSGLVISDNTYRVMLVPSGRCTGEFISMYGYLAVHEMAEGLMDTPPELLADAPLQLQMDVTDTSSRTTSASLSVIAALDPADVGDTGFEPPEGEL